MSRPALMSVTVYELCGSRLVKSPRMYAYSVPPGFGASAPAPESVPLQAAVAARVAATRAMTVARRRKRLRRGAAPAMGVLPQSCIVVLTAPAPYRDHPDRSPTPGSRGGSGTL